MKDCNTCEERPDPGEVYDQTPCASCVTRDQRAVDEELARNWRETQWETARLENVPDD